jgi:hypothetical protein
MYSSNTPISRPAVMDYDVDAYCGGLAWNEKRGFFFPVEADILPMKLPYLLSYQSIQGG